VNISVIMLHGRGPIWHIYNWTNVFLYDVRRSSNRMDGFYSCPL